LHLATHMAPPSLNTVRGFTLIEAVVAATLIATALVALAHLVAVGTRQAARNRHDLAALVAAQGKLEQLRAVIWRFTDPRDGLTPSPPRSLLEDAAGFVDAAGTYVLRWAMLPIDVADANTLVLQACAYVARAPDQPPAACVATIRTREP
jgi:hypothetical protein